MLNKTKPDNAASQDAWDALCAHKSDWDEVSLSDVFDADPQRFDRYHITYEGFLFDYSKNHINDKTLDILKNLAASKGLTSFIQAMRAGEKLNTTEKRAVLHCALRGSVDTGVNIDGENIDRFVSDLHQQMKIISDQLRHNDAITDVIHIGVGGSNLGPDLVCQALATEHTGPRLHFLKNIDGQSVEQCLSKLSPKSTAVLIASKSFTTLETSYNAKHIKNWMQKDLSESEINQRLFAMTACPDQAQNSGSDGSYPADA